MTNAQSKYATDQEEAARTIQQAWRSYYTYPTCTACDGYCAVGYSLCFECLSEQMEGVDEYDDDYYDHDDESLDDYVLCQGCGNRRAQYVDTFKTPVCTRCWLDRCSTCGSFQHTRCW